LDGGVADIHVLGKGFDIKLTSWKETTGALAFKEIEILSPVTQSGNMFDMRLLKVFVLGVRYTIPLALAKRLVFKLV
jgi:hypothetical protein